MTRAKNIRIATLNDMPSTERQEECFHHLSRAVDEVIRMCRQIMQDYRDTEGKMYGYDPVTYLRRADFTGRAEDRIAPAIHGLRLNGETAVMDKLEERFRAWILKWKVLAASMPSRKPRARSELKSLCNDTADTVDTILDDLEDAVRTALRHYNAEWQIKV